MFSYFKSYDAIVIGGGHAGCEATWALAQLKCSVLLITLTLESIAQMSCNPSIGGTAKGHLTREIDALGGIMGRVADTVAIQYRKLNASKGPAVQSTRAQCDATLYKHEMLRRLGEHPNISIVQAEVKDILFENGEVKGVVTQSNICYKTKAVVLCTGTFLRGLCHIGDYHFEAGRAGDIASNALSGSLKDANLSLIRLKTGTPPRLDAKSLDWNSFELQPGDAVPRRFSFYETPPLLPQQPCYIAYTTPHTHDIIRAARERSPLFNGTIQGTGPRYCPSIEDKCFRFADKDRHQIFLEPMGLNSNEIYPAGISSSLPFDVQLEFIHSIPGFEKAHVIRPAYAVEYDALATGQITYNMSIRGIPSLFAAGQINCTSGYEEAAAQGLMAGINAALYIKGEQPFILKRNEAYIGVMIDDLVLLGVDEPYRMFTSRAEFRLSLREDNADTRLSPLAYKLGLLQEKDWNTYQQKQQLLDKLQNFIATTKLSSLSRQNLTAQEAQKIPETGTILASLKRPEVTLGLLSKISEELASFPKDVLETLETNIKFEGYIQRENKKMESFVQLEEKCIPDSIQYDRIPGLSTELVNKLKHYKPYNLSEASRIPEITPAAINALWVYIRSHKF